jgi:hypothetical protein
MRGQVDPQSGLFSYFSVEERVPVDHPLRRIKPQADAVLVLMSSAFDAMYADAGRPSVAPERLLKASLLIALYSVRSDRPVPAARRRAISPARLVGRRRAGSALGMASGEGRARIPGSVVERPTYRAKLSTSCCW